MAGEPDDGLSDGDDVLNAAAAPGRTHAEAATITLRLENFMGVGPPWIFVAPDGRGGIGASL